MFDFHLKIEIKETHNFSKEKIYKIADVGIQSVSLFTYHNCCLVDRGYMQFKKKTPNEHILLWLVM